VPDPHGPALDTYRTRIEGQPPPTPAHITLVPPTVTPGSRVDGVVAHVSSVASAHSPFSVHLRGTGTFRPVSPVVFVGLVDGSTSCHTLAADLRTGPLRSEQAFPYHPHVTIAHDLPDARLDEAYRALATFEARYPVAALTVYENRRGSWQVVDEFPLGR